MWEWVTTGPGSVLIHGCGPGTGLDMMVQEGSHVLWP